MTDNEIIKALECCGDKICKQCPNFSEDIECSEKLIKLALDLINRQKERIKQLWEDCDYFENKVKTIKSEAIREFAERLKAEIKSDLYGDDVMPRGTIDWLVRKMTEQ